MGKPLIAIVGRPNVGKSTLFNRLVGRRAAVVSDIPGTTRDRISLDAEWAGRHFIIVDTGGLVPDPATPLAERVQSQVEMAIDAADGIIFMADVQDGLTAVDVEIANRLRQSGKPVTLAVNKADNTKLTQATVEFYQMGLGEPLPISAHHNLGIFDLIDEVLKAVPPSEQVDAETDIPSIAIVGRVNVGKSALLNAILGQERTIVSDMPGTTRDAIDTPIQYQNRQVTLIDTAGVRRRGRIVPGIERYSVLRTIQAINRADVALLILDATDLAAAQDIHIAGQIMDAFKGTVVAVNKWDMAPELGLDQAECLAKLRGSLKFMPYAPIRFISALEGTGVMDVLDTALAVHDERGRTISRKQLSTAVMNAMAAHQPPSRGRRSLRLDRVAQEGTHPPSFTFYVNDPSLVHFSYRRFLENRLRESLGFQWSHLKLVFKGRIARSRNRQKRE